MFTLGHVHSVGALSGTAVLHGVDGVRLEVRMVMTVDLFEHFHGDSEEPTNLMRRDALLRLPGNRRVTQNVRVDVVQTGGAGERGKALGDAQDRLTAPFDDGVPRPVTAVPAAQVRQQAGRDPNRRLPFVGSAPADRFSIEYATLEIDPSAAFGRCQGCATNRAGARPGVQAHQYKVCQMPRLGAPQTRRNADAAEQQIWVLRNAKPVRIPVVAGASNGQETVVTSPQLRPGDAVITAVAGTGS